MWTIAQVDEHMKGLTQKEKKAWVSIANKSLMDCMDKGGEEPKCAGRALRIANGAMKNMHRMQEGNAFSIQHMEVFKVGEWNKYDYKLEDLEIMVKSFHGLRGTIKPKLKLTHLEDQESLAGLASYGDITNLYLEGDTIFVDIDNVPAIVIEWIKTKRFAERSIEMYRVMTLGDKTFKNVITAVSLLGHEIPAVLGMCDVALPFNEIRTEHDIEVLAFSLENDINIKETLKEGGDAVDEKQIAEFNEKIVAISAELAEAQKKLSEKDEEVKVTLQAEISKLETQKSESEALKATLEDTKVKLAEAELKAEEAKVLIAEAEAKKLDVEIAKFISDKKAEGKITPAVEEEVKALYLCMTKDSNKLTFSSKKENGQTETVETSSLELFKAILNKLPKVVDTQTYTKADEDSTEESVVKEDRFVRVKGNYDIEGLEKDTQIKKYMEDHKLTYGKAMLEIEKIEKNRKGE